MTRWLTYLMGGVFILFSLSGCAEEQASTAPAPQPAAVAPPPAQSVAAPVAEQVVEEPVMEYVYDATGRRDPFLPLSNIRKPVVQSDEPATPLQSYDVEQFRLTGVIVGKGTSKAMVVAPDGKSYVLSKGVRIGKNSGVVKEISSQVILVEEKYYDFSGNVITNILEITVPKREGV